tara:strand:+ start:452 stop:625 length:174 start_codon:yes stop_codon:yes gene_type:complete
MLTDSTKIKLDLLIVFLMTFVCLEIIDENMERFNMIYLTTVFLLGFLLGQLIEDRRK